MGSSFFNFAVRIGNKHCDKAFQMVENTESKDPTPEGPALETPGGGYNALPPEGARVELPLSC